MLTYPPVGLADVVRAILGLPLVRRTPGQHYQQRLAELREKSPMSGL